MSALWVVVNKYSNPRGLDFYPAHSNDVLVNLHEPCCCCRLDTKSNDICKIIDLEYIYFKK